MTPRIEPFRVVVPDPALDDLRARLDRTRLPARLPGAGWRDGADLDTLAALLDHWRHGYDWRAAETRLNGFAHFVTETQGERLHFIHQRSPEPDALPLVITHGWPGSVVEFQDVIGPLSDPRAHGADPRDAFHVVCPSMPGYAFSGPTRQPGFDVHRVADAVADLMQALGYDRYLAQGGDWGALVTRRLGETRAERLVGVHFNMLFCLPENLADPAAWKDVTPEELERFQQAAARIADGTGYMAIQSTKPQSLGVGLNDSPAALAAWQLEKFHAWTDHDGDVTTALSFDQILTNVMLYWLTGTRDVRGPSLRREPAGGHGGHLALERPRGRAHRIRAISARAAAASPGLGRAALPGRPLERAGARRALRRLRAAAGVRRGPPRLRAKGPPRADIPSPDRPDPLAKRSGPARETRSGLARETRSGLARETRSGLARETQMQDRPVGPDLDVLPLLEQATPSDLGAARGSHADPHVAGGASVETFDHGLPISSLTHSTHSSLSSRSCGFSRVPARSYLLPTVATCSYLLLPVLSHSLRTIRVRRSACSRSIVGNLGLGWGVGHRLLRIGSPRCAGPREATARETLSTSRTQRCRDERDERHEHNIERRVAAREALTRTGRRVEFFTNDIVEFYKRTQSVASATGR